MIVKGTKQLSNFKRGINLHIPEKKIPLKPIKDGLILWLKADAGVSLDSVNQTFINQIIISNSGRESSDGIYTRDVGGNVAFRSSNGNIIYWNSDANQWILYDKDQGAGQYSNSNFSFESDWQSINGPNSSCDAAYTSTTKITNRVTQWIDQSENQNNATPIQDHAPYLSSILNKPCIKFYSSASYSPDFNALTIPGDQFDITINPTIFVVQRTLIAEPYANGNIFGQFGGVVNRKNQISSGYGILYGGDYGGGFDPNIGESTYSNLPLTLFAVRPNTSNGQAKTVTIFNDSFLNLKDITISAGRYNYTGFLNRGPMINFSEQIGNNLNNNGQPQNRVLIGSAYDLGVENFNGEIYEIIFYNRTLTDNEFESVVNYLSKKYNFNSNVINTPQSLCLGGASAQAYMKGWEAGDRFLTKFSDTLYTYGAEQLIRNEDGTWTYQNIDYGPVVITNSINSAEAPWLASWPNPFFCLKSC